MIRTIRYSVSSRWRCLCDQIHDLRWHAGKLRSAIELYRAIGRRGRNGIRVYWSTLEPEEQATYAKLLRVQLHDCWHTARVRGGKR
jgi:hypothetical protein